MALKKSLLDESGRDFTKEIIELDCDKSYVLDTFPGFSAGSSNSVFP